MHRLQQQPLPTHLYFHLFVSVPRFAFSVLPTVKLSMLNPLLANKPETLVNTPEEFLTKTDKTCLSIYITPKIK